MSDKPTSTPGPDREPDPGGPGPREPDPREAAAARIREQHRWVDLQIQRAMERGEFDDLPGAGKPIEGLGGDPDPDWWTKRLIAREQLTGIAPPAISLRREDAELDALLDRETSETEVRRLVADFNRRVIEARRQLQGGPPVVTPTRDVDAEVARWRARREERRAAQRALLEAERERRTHSPRRRRWFRPPGAPA